MNNPNLDILSTVPRTLGWQLRRVITQCGFTRFLMCRKLGLCGTALERFVKCQGGLSMKTIVKLVAFHDLQLCDIRPFGGRRWCSASASGATPEFAEGRSENARVRGEGSPHEIAAFDGQLRQAICVSGQTQRSICRTIGISEPALSQFMSGKMGLAWETVERLALHLNLEFCHTTPFSRDKWRV